MNHKGYVILNQELTSTQAIFINEYAQNYSMYSKNVLVLTGNVHYLALKEIAEDLYSKDLKTNTVDDIFIKKNAIIVLNDYDSYKYNHIKHADIQLAMDLSQVSENQLVYFKQLYEQWQSYDSIQNIGQLPIQLKEEIATKQPELMNIENNTQKTLAIYKLYIELIEKNFIKEKVK